MARIGWQGVFPAVTTQFHEDLSLDLAATRRQIERLLTDGVDGLILCGTVGEGTSLTAAEKRATVEMAVDVARGRVPVVVGVAEYTTELARELARDCGRIGANGLMVMPAMVYSARSHETLAHFRAVAAASSLPVMLYNNPPIYRTDVTPDMVASLADVETIVAVKESAGMTSRYVDLANAVGDRFVLFCGLDDVVLESVLLGCVGWVSGMSNVFPHEANALFRLARAGRWTEALALYRWFMPVLHLDARPDLVQCIKLCEQIAGRGSERTRPPRLALQGAVRAEIEGIMQRAQASRPQLAKAA
jgi:dihydrodipicolinate synthase/N-acetylneuraminate lyase